MRASESPSQSYKTKRILFFVNLICSSVSRLKALKNMSAFCHTQLQWKVMERFRNCVRKVWTACSKIAFIEKIFRKKKFADTFLLFIKLDALHCLDARHPWRYTVTLNHTEENLFSLQVHFYASKTRVRIKAFARGETLWACSNLKAIANRLFVAENGL